MEYINQIACVQGPAELTARNDWSSIFYHENSNYPNFATCRWVISAPDQNSQKIELEIMSRRANSLSTK